MQHVPASGSLFLFYPPLILKYNLKPGACPSQVSLLIIRKSETKTLRYYLPKTTLSNQPQSSCLRVVRRYFVRFCPLSSSFRDTRLVSAVLLTLGRIYIQSVDSIDRPRVPDRGGKNCHICRQALHATIKSQ